MSNDSGATLDLLSRRRSVGPMLLEAPAPEGEALDRLLTIASRVPDHGRLAPWRFIVIRGAARERLGAMIAAWAKADDPDVDEKRLEQERNRLSRAPLVVAVVSRAAAHPKIPEWEQTLSAGAVCMNLSVAANAMGYSTSWLTEWIGYDRRVLDALGLDVHERIAGFIYIGTAREAPAERARPSLADIVTTLEA